MGIWKYSLLNLMGMVFLSGFLLIYTAMQLKQVNIMDNNQILSIEGLSGREVENLYLQGKLDHLRDQRLSSKQILEMVRAKVPEMMKKGIIHSEPVPV
jgi:hypothetical protein